MPSLLIAILKLSLPAVAASMQGSPTPLVPATPGFLSQSLSQLQAPPPPLQAPSLLPTLLNIVFSLGLVLVLVYATVWFLKRWMSARGAQGGVRQPEGQGPLIRVLDRLYLDNKRGLAVVEMGGDVLFLGLGDQVTLLGEVKDSKKAESIRQSAGSRSLWTGFPEQFERIGSLLKKSQWQKTKSSLKMETESLKDRARSMRSLGEEEGE